MVDLINKDLVLLDIKVKSKDDVINKLSMLLKAQDRLSNIKGFIKQVYFREGEFPTSVGFSFAIPHGKCSYVKTPTVAFARLKDEIVWSEEDNVKYIFLIAVSDTDTGDEHLKILANLSRKIIDKDFRNQLEQAKDIESILSILNIEDDQLLD
jgi:fructose PTS system EIIA component